MKAAFHLFRALNIKGAAFVWKLQLPLQFPSPLESFILCPSTREAEEGCAHSPLSNRAGGTEQPTGRGCCKCLPLPLCAPSKPQCFSQRRWSVIIINTHFKPQRMTVKKQKCDFHCTNPFSVQTSCWNVVTIASPHHLPTPFAVYILPSAAFTGLERVCSVLHFPYPGKCAERTLQKGVLQGSVWRWPWGVFIEVRVRPVAVTLEKRGAFSCYLKHTLE